MPIANLPSPLAYMVFCTVGLPQAFPVSLPRELIQALLLNQWSTENPHALNSPYWLCSYLLLSPQDLPSMAMFTGPFHTVTAEGLGNREHTQKPVRFFCTVAHALMTSKVLYHLLRIDPFEYILEAGSSNSQNGHAWEILCLRVCPSSLASLSMTFNGLIIPPVAKTLEGHTSSAGYVIHGVLCKMKMKGLLFKNY